MQYSYKDELTPYLAKSDEDIMTYVEEILAKSDSENRRKVQELSSLLRRRKPTIAAKVAEKLYTAEPTPGNLNLYFVAVIDEGNGKKIRELDKKAVECVKSPRTNMEQRKHLYATQLKAANRIQDNDMFKRVYAEIPDEDKVKDKYIVNQYYIYLNRNKSYQEVVSRYQSLDITMQEDNRIRDRYNDAMSAIKAQDSSVFLIGSNSDDLQIPELILQSLRVRVIKITGEDTSEIIKNMEADKSGSRFVFAYETAFDEFEWGYFLGKVGASNLVLITDDENAGNAFSSHGFKKPVILSVKWDNLDTRKKALAEPMRNSGLNVYLE